MTLRVQFEDHPLLFITDRKRSLERGNIKVVREALKGGCRWIMYREPDLDDETFYDGALKVKEICDEVGAGLIVNKRLDIAALVQAHGIHLGKGSLPVRIVKEYMGEDFIVGYSAHTLQEAVTAVWEGADYITYSPIFRMIHKDSPYEPHGIDGAIEVMKKVDAPVYFLGGIGLEDLPEMARQIHPLRIACVSMISEAEDIVDAAEQALNILEAGLNRGS